MPKAKPVVAEPVGLVAETYTYKSTGQTNYVIVDYSLPKKIEDTKINRVIFESSTAQTRDYVLARMQEREAERVEKVVELVLDN